MKRARKNTIKKGNGAMTKPKKRLRISSVFKALLVLVLILIGALFVALGFGFISEEELLAPIDRESGRINALILGVDNDGLRTDTVMVASLDLETSQVSILSIPRDTKLYVKNRKMTRKMTEIHAMGTQKGDGTIVGPVGTAEAVAALTGIPINYYVEFSFDSVKNIFNTLGPITYDVPDVEGKGRGMNYEDPVQDLYIHLKPGVQELDADKILQFIRYRKGDSDFARIDRQQGIIKAVVEQKLNLSLLFKLPKLFTQLNKDILTNISVSDVRKYSQYLTKLSTDGIKTYQLPGESKRLKAGWYFICDIEETKKLVSEVFECDTSKISTTVEVYAKSAGIKAVKSEVSQIGTPLKNVGNSVGRAVKESYESPAAEAAEELIEASETDEPLEEDDPEKNDAGEPDTDEKNDSQSDTPQQRDPEPTVILLD